MRRLVDYGGIAASIVLVIIGIGAISAGFVGRSQVNDKLSAEQIVGTPDMTPAAIKAEAAKAGLNVKNLSIPSDSVAGQKIDTPAKARVFADYMRIHTLEATGGQVYSQMGRYLDKNGKATDNQAQAAVDPKTNKPVENQARNIWVTETALTTALNTSYFAQSVATFSIVVGFAMLLAGIGFGILTARTHEKKSAERSAQVQTAAAAV